MSLVQTILYYTPTLYLGIALVAMSVLLSVGGLLLVHRYIPHQKLKVHHDIAGAIFGTLGMAYTVLIAFVVVVAWQGFDKASLNTEMEANFLTDLMRDSGALSRPFAQQVRALVDDYVKAVVNEEWKTIAQGKPSAHVQDVVNKLGTLYSSYAPATVTEEVFFRESVHKLNELSELRRQRLVDAKSGLHPVLWFVLIIGGIGTIVFTFFFGAEDVRAQILMTSILAALIALILLTIMVFDFPFTGDVNVSPDAFTQMIKY